MELRELLEVGRMLKSEKCNNIKEYLEKILELNNTQIQDVYLISENGVDLERAIDGVADGCYCIYENFYEYIDNLTSELCTDLPNFIELDYISMWYRTFRYDENLFIDWQELKWCKDRDEYGTAEQKENQRAYIEYNLQYSQVIDFYY